MKIDVTNIKVTKMKRLLKKVRKRYGNGHLKSSGTKEGRKTYIVYRK